MKKLLVNLTLIVFVLLTMCLGLSACDEFTSSDYEGWWGHTHKFAQEWSSDDNYHWHASICEHKDEISDKAEHNWEIAKMNIAATCTSNGEGEYVCKDCGYQKTIMIPATGHAWTNNCDMECNNLCGISRTVTHLDNNKDDLCDVCNINVACKHTITQKLDAKAPTCTQTGLTEGVKCTLCGDILISQSVVNALGHTEVIVAMPVAPTCTTSGLTAAKKCATCNVALESQTVIAALGHIEIIDFGYAATCTESGLTDGKHCGECGAVLISQTVIEQLPHNETVIKGYSATCTKTGLTDGKQCAVCKKITVEQDSIDALGHNEIIVYGYDSTCTKTGLTNGKKCSVCQEILVAQQNISMKLHTEIVVPGYVSTCTKNGVDDSIKCSTCNLVIRQGETLPLAPHSVNTDGTQCTSCQKVLAVAYDSYEYYVSACTTSTSGNNITVTYNREMPIILRLSRFVLNSGKTYTFRFGGAVTQVKFEGAGGSYNNVIIAVDSNTKEFNLELNSISLSNYNSIIYSNAPCLNLTISGSSCVLQTEKSWNGADGESYGAFQIGNGGNGGNGGNANTVIVCNGTLNITCATSVTIRGGAGGNGGNGGNSNSSGSTGGTGGNGGNGGSAIKASAIIVCFKNNVNKNNISFSAGVGGNGGAGGYGSLLFGAGKKYAPNGANGTSPMSTNVTVQYK